MPKHCTECGAHQDMSWWMNLTPEQKWAQRDYSLYQVKRHRRVDGQWRYSLDSVCKDCRNAHQRATDRNKAFHMKQDWIDSPAYQFLCKVRPTS